MNRISSYQELKEASKRFQELIDPRKLQEATTGRRQLLVCGGTGCTSSDSLLIIEALEKSIKEHGLTDVDVIKVGCFGFCGQGPIVKTMPDDVFYTKVTPEDAEEIVAKHMVQNEPVDRILYVDPETGEHIHEQHLMRFYGKQVRIALRLCGLANPEDIREYIAFGGYHALGKALTEMTPEEVIQVVKDSGLRGRGGGGFSTGMKWTFARATKSNPKYMICNADEGDPGAFMDRSIMEGDPNAVLEAMAIGAYATGATDGIIYCRAEYPLAIKRLEIAISQAREAGLLGKDILGTGFNFDIHIKPGAGAFVCGEETALIASLEGGRGMPRLKPPFPAVKGLFEKSTNINNVETFANVPFIILYGADKFKEYGTQKSAGTKVFALTGKCNNGGLVEVPMGTPLSDIIFNIGGGIKDGKEFKAVQMGGPSGGCIPASLVDTPVDYENIQATGAIVGSGGMVVMDQDTCMVEMARFFLDFTCRESCGKCTYCRLGTKRMLEILTRITKGEGKEGDIELLEELANKIKEGSLCGLGQTAPNPVLTTLRYFRDEYEAHIKEKRCPAHQCKSLISYHITDKCIGCHACFKVCPVSAISGQVKSKHEIDPNVCIKCGQCYRTCRFKAIEIR
ncbi:NADH-ubiquinone oxidoreductase-F iron-sulfur binding region domain-containing protein [Guggenheimella bovis]